MKQFRSVKAEGSDVAMHEQRLILVPHPKCMCRVVDHLQPMPVSNHLNALNVAWVTINVHRQDRRRPWGDGRFDQVGIQAQRLWVDVHEDRLTTFPNDAGRGGHIGKGCSDDLAVQVKRLDGDLQGNGTVADEEEMLDAQELLESGFQLFHQRAVVGDPVALPDAPEVLDILFQWRQVGLGDVNHDFRLRIIHFSRKYHAFGMPASRKNQPQIGGR